MRNAAIALVLIIGSCVLEKAIASDYCNPSLCPSGYQHIACGNDGKFSDRCSNDVQLIAINEALRDVLLGKHNELRNEIAGGRVEGYAPAVRMASMRWDAELAALAELNVKKCKLEHDKCRNTRKFKRVGQNLGYDGWYGSTQEVAVKVIQSWFNEYKYTSMKSIISYVPSRTKHIGHFTLLVQDQATHVGCAILQQTQGEFLFQYMACNYAYPNVKYAAVYASGNEPASACRTGKNPKYLFLCSESEIYDSA